MKINWNVRFKNPVFWGQILLSIATPIMAYFGLTGADFTTWGMIWDTLVKAISNPYVVGLAVVSCWNALNDPTTKGISDSEQALTYDKPKDDTQGFDE